MKKITILLSAIFGTAMISFGQTDYKMWEVTYIKPTTDNVGLLMENLAAHVKKFHASGPHKVSVWSNLTGSHVADLAWVTGPFTFTDLDTPRADEKAHEADWNKNIEPYVDVTASEYWNQFESKDGRDAVIETNFTKWAFFDEDDQFVKDYEEVHGEGTYRLAIEEYRDIVIGVEDELSEMIPELSGE